MSFKNPKVEKFNGLNFPIVNIKFDNEGSVYIINDIQKIYHLNLHGWDSEKCIDKNYSHLKFLFNYNNEIIDKEKCKEENQDFIDSFKVTYRFLTHDEIKLQLSPRTALNINDFYQRDKSHFKIYLFLLIKDIRNIDATGGGRILDSDYDTAVNFIYNHFSYYIAKLIAHLKIKERIQDKVLIISTNRVGYLDSKKIYIWDYKLSKKEWIKTYNYNNEHELRRIKRENVGINENKWTEDFSKSINQEQHLSTINDNYVINNVTATL